MQGIKLSINKETIELLAKQYSDTLAAKKLNIAVSSFYLLRKKYEVPSFTKLTKNKQNRKTGEVLLPGQGVSHPQYNNLKIETFDCIDTEHKAYFLGLMAADGHTSLKPDAKFMSLELQKPDSEVLKKFACLLNYEGEIESISREGKKPSEKLLIYSRKLTESLIKNGISETTETHSISTFLPKKLRRHFLRGLIDGDGHIKFSTKALNLTVSSEALIKTVSEWCLEEFNIKTSLKVRTLKSGKLFYRLTFGGKPKLILKWTYQDASVYIERKKVEAEKWLCLFK